jgi:hypothetical protein
VPFESYLGNDFLDESCLHINIKILMNQLETNQKVILFFEQKPYLKRFKFYLQKNFTYTLDITCTDY